MNNRAPWIGLFQKPIPQSSAGMQLHNPLNPLPSLVPPAWPMGGVDPRGYQPNYQPGNASDGWTGFTYLQLGANRGATENTISFNADLAEKVKQAGQTAPVPTPYVLTLAPSTIDLQALGLAAAAIVRFYYKVEYVFDSQFPNYIEGAVDRSAAPGAADGYQPLSIRGIKIQLRSWAVRVWVKATGTGHATATTWAAPVRIDAFLSPGGLPAGAGGNVLPRLLSDPTSSLPTFSHSVIVPAPIGIVGAAFTFANIGGRPIQNYDLGPDVVPIPPDAATITGSVGDLYGIFYLY